MSAASLSSNKASLKRRTERRGAVLRLPDPRGPSVELAFTATSMENTP
jgi:hypothetical protein